MTIQTGKMNPQKRVRTISIANDVDLATEAFVTFGKSKKITNVSAAIEAGLRLLMRKHGAPETLTPDAYNALVSTQTPKPRPRRGRQGGSGA